MIVGIKDVFRCFWNMMRACARHYFGHPLIKFSLSHILQSRGFDPRFLSIIMQTSLIMSILWREKSKYLWVWILKTSMKSSQSAHAYDVQLETSLPSCRPSEIDISSTSSRVSDDEQGCWSVSSSAFFINNPPIWRKMNAQNLFSLMNVKAPKNEKHIRLTYPFCSQNLEIFCAHLDQASNHDRVIDNKYSLKPT